MAFYKQIELRNLDTIIEKSLELLPEEDRWYTHLFYIDDNVEKFLKIPELADELKRLGFYEHVFCIAFYIVMPGSINPIHLDSGFPVYSFNIPLSGCKGTGLNFYESSAEPVATTTAQNKIFYAYNNKDCKLIESYEMLSPTVINVKIPHNITNNNVEPRVTLLIRLNETVGELF